MRYSYDMININHTFVKLEMHFLCWEVAFEAPDFASNKIDFRGDLSPLFLLGDMQMNTSKVRIHAAFNGLERFPASSLFRDRPERLVLLAHSVI
jgi:hypothetical protein